MNKIQSNISQDIMSLMTEYLPFACEIFEKYKLDKDSKAIIDSDLIDLLPSNYAVFFSYLAVSDDYNPEIIGISRESLIEKAVSALDIMNSKEIDAICPFAWSYASFAIITLGNRVPLSLKEGITAKVVLCADHLLGYTFPSGMYNDTKAEETCWNAGPLVSAEFLAPDHPNVEAWKEKAFCFFLNAYNREEDNWCDKIIDGKPVRERVSTANVFPDFTTENHGFFHPVYQVCFNNYAIPYILYKLHIKNIPESITWNWKELHEVTSRILMGDGGLFFPAGSDYPSCSHWWHTHYWALIADALKDPLALWALKKNIAKAEDWQKSIDLKGRLYPREILNEGHEFREIHEATFLCFAHALAPFEGIENIDDTQALRYMTGPWHSPYTRIALYKGKKLHMGMTLDHLRPMGFVIPQTFSNWNNMYGSFPNLSAVIKDSTNNIIRMREKSHIMGHSDNEVWALGQYSDKEGSILHSIAFIANEEGALHIERVLRYGEQVPIFGYESHSERRNAKGDKYKPWNISTLNYRVTNDITFPRSIHIETEEGQKILDGNNCEWNSESPWLLIDGTVGLIRLWGDCSWSFIYKRDQRPSPIYNHDAYSFTCGLVGRKDSPSGYGFLGEHAVLIVESANSNQLKEILSGNKCNIEENHGRFSIKMMVNSWKAEYQLNMGHILDFAIK